MNNTKIHFVKIRGKCRAEPQRINITLNYAKQRFISVDIIRQLFTGLIGLSQTVIRL